MIISILLGISSWKFLSGNTCLKLFVRTSLFCMDFQYANTTFEPRIQQGVKKEFLIFKYATT